MAQKYLAKFAGIRRCRIAMKMDKFMKYHKDSFSVGCYKVYIKYHKVSFSVGGYMMLYAVVYQLSLIL